MSVASLDLILDGISDCGEVTVADSKMLNKAPSIDLFIRSSLVSSFVSPSLGRGSLHRAGRWRPRCSVRHTGRDRTLPVPDRGTYQANTQSPRQEEKQA